MTTDTIQENWGTANPGGTTSLVIPLTGGNNPGGVGTTAGNTIVLFLSSPGTSVSAIPSGWGTDTAIAGALYAFRASEVAASQTSWTLTLAATSSVDFSFYVAELSGVDPVVPLEVSTSATGGSKANGGTLSTGTTALNAALNTVAFAVFAADSNVSSTWSGYTGAFEEVQEVTTAAGSTRNLAVARKFTTVTETFESTATLATSGSNSTTSEALLVVYRADGSPVVAPLTHLQGFEHGTDGGGTGPTNGAAALYGAALSGGAGTWGTSQLVQAGSARNGGYGFRVIQSGAAAYRRIGNVGAKAGSLGWNVRVVSATGSVVVNEIVNTSLTVVAQLLYDTSTSKYGVRCGTTGTTSWQSGTTATGTWVWVDLRLKINTTTWHADWRLETATDTYTDQAAAELTGQSAAGTIGPLNAGANVAQTMTADYDDVVMSPYYTVYPLTAHQVRLLTVDVAGTPTLSGTSTNFSVFTANGTLAAWNATNARDAVDEVPPTVSASADGVCQTAVAASDYIEFPMAAPTLADDEVISGVRMLTPMWGGTGTGTGTVGVRGWDDTAETILIPASVSYDAGSPTVVSATEPYWQCAMWAQANGWTATKLAAAALRFGFSTDATPDMGCDALYLEYATRKTSARQLFGDLVSQEANPNTEGIRSVAVSPSGGYDASLHVDLDGTPTDTATPGGTVTSQTLDAEGGPNVSYVALYPPPEDISDA
ncbi:MAG TPA: hypothetical protein VGJ86_13525 [Acidimicrobiales bacterium]